MSDTAPFRCEPAKGRTVIEDENRPTAVVASSALLADVDRIDDWVALIILEADTGPSVANGESVVCASHKQGCRTMLGSIAWRQWVDFMALREVISFVADHADTMTDSSVHRRL
jgi:hypothetical protein